MTVKYKSDDKTSYYGWYNINADKPVTWSTDVNANSRNGNSTARPNFDGLRKLNIVTDAQFFQIYFLPLPASRTRGERESADASLTELLLILRACIMRGEKNCIQESCGRYDSPEVDPHAR